LSPGNQKVIDHQIDIVKQQIIDETRWVEINFFKLMTFGSITEA